VYHFAEYVANHIEKIFFLSPKDILTNPIRIKNIKKLAKTFHFRLPKGIFKSKQSVA
jgi:hypothetical protein